MASIMKPTNIILIVICIITISIINTSKAASTDSIISTEEGKSQASQNTSEKSQGKSQASQNTSEKSQGKSQASKNTSEKSQKKTKGSPVVNQKKPGFNNWLKQNLKLDDHEIAKLNPKTLYSRK